MRKIKGIDNNKISLSTLKNLKGTLDNRVREIYRQAYKEGFEDGKESVRRTKMSEYIKREDVIKEAKAWSMFLEDDLVSRLENLPSIEIDDWTPVSERLPDTEYGEGDSVLCCTESGLMYILYWNGGNWCVPTGEPHHWVNHKTGWHDKVIAWKPLPEPYEE